MRLWGISSGGDRSGKSNELHSQKARGGLRWVMIFFFLIFALIASDFNRHIITIIINGENGVDEYTFCLHSMVNCIGEKTVLISN